MRAGAGAANAASVFDLADPETRPERAWCTRPIVFRPRRRFVGMTQSTANPVIIRPSVRRNPGAFVRMLASIGLASALVAIVATSPAPSDFSTALQLGAGLLVAYGLWTFRRWRYRTRIEVSDRFLIVYGTRERRGVWFQRRDIKALLADANGMRVVGARGTLGTMSSTDWHGRAARAVTDVLGCRSRGVWPSAVLSVPRTAAHPSGGVVDAHLKVPTPPMATFGGGTRCVRRYGPAGRVRAARRVFPHAGGRVSDGLCPGHTPPVNRCH